MKFKEKAVRKLLFIVLLLGFLISVLMGVTSNTPNIAVIYLVIAVLIVILILITIDAVGSKAFRTKNKTPEQVEVALIDLFNMANREVLIYSGTLDKNIFSEKVQNSLKDAVEKRKVAIKAIASTNNPSQHKFINWLSDRGSINFLEEDVAPHFIVVDSLHIRSEHLHDKNDTDRTADIHFYNPNLARFYISKFSKLEERIGENNGRQTGSGKR